MFKCVPFGLYKLYGYPQQEGTTEWHMRDNILICDRKKSANGSGSYLTHGRVAGCSSP